jgi:hypothetical protein
VWCIGSHTTETVHISYKQSRCLSNVFLLKVYRNNKSVDSSDENSTENEFVPKKVVLEEDNVLTID